MCASDKNVSSHAEEALAAYFIRKNRCNANRQLKIKKFTKARGNAITSNNKQPKPQEYGYSVLKMTCKLNLQDIDSLGTEQRRSMQVTQLANYQNSFTMSYHNP
jgi:hypothetical protein